LLFLLLVLIKFENTKNTFAWEIKFWIYARCACLANTPLSWTKKCIWPLQVAERVQEEEPQISRDIDINTRVTMVGKNTLAASLYA
jgi:hypothetical protein